MIINTALSLCYHLADELRKHTALITASDSGISPNVFVGKLPRRAVIIEPEEETGFWVEEPKDIQIPETSEETVFPYILIRPTDGVDEATDASDLGFIASITITVGSQSYHDDGFVDVCYLIDAIRIKLLEQERFGNGIVQKPLAVSYPNFEDFDTQNHYFGDMFIKFEMPTIERKRSAFL